MAVRIKSKVVKSTLANKDVTEMFQNILGGDGTVNLNIAYPKYLKLRDNTDRFVNVLLPTICKSSLMTQFPEQNKFLIAYSETLRKQYLQSFSAPNIDEYYDKKDIATPYSKVPPNVLKEFSECFEQVKKCNVVNVIIVTCNNLIAHKTALNNMKDKFLIGPGSTFNPLPDLPQVNFKHIYSSSPNPNDRTWVLLILKKMFEVSHDVYEALSMPDVDVNEFAEVIMKSIEEVKKHIPRCDGAFAKIIESVDLLKSNFKNYYGDFVASNNPTIIMEHFVIDVSKNTKASPQITAQFRKIISHYKKLASQRATNPKLKNLFDQVDLNFQELERKSKKQDGDAAEDDEEVEGDEDAEDEVDDEVDEVDEVDEDDIVFVEKGLNDSTLE